MALVIAHRGASASEPENSLAAFARALDLGADGIELDVHATADGHLVVLHDPELDGRDVAALPLERVQAHHLANREPVPTLAEALDVITPKAIAFVELKRLPAHCDEALFAAFDQSPRPERCHVHAFDHRIVRRLTGRRPGLSAGVLAASYPLDPAAPVAEAGATVLWQHADLVDAPLAALVHEAGFRLYAWTVDRPERMRRLLADGVDGICTNRPDVARELMG
jgi:glycerophosphoryl diester phosphodiesterase